MKKRKNGESKSLLSKLDFIILDCLINNTCLCKRDISKKTKGAEQHIKNRLDNLKKYKLIKINKSNKGNKFEVSINEQEKDFIIKLLEVFR